MLSTLNRPEQDPHDVIEIAPDVVLAARSDTPPPTPATGAVSGPSAPEVRVTAPEASTPSVDPTFRATTLDDIRIPGERSALGKWAIRTFFACLFAICSAVAAAAWQRYGDEAQQMLADWTPPRISLSSLFSSDKPKSSEQSASLATAAAGADQASAQATTSPPPPTPPRPAPAQDTAAAAPAPLPTAAAPSTGATQLMQSMAHDITAMSQQMADLKASIDQLKARQEQMSRDLAKVAEAKVAEAKAAEAKATEMRAFERQKILPPQPRVAAVPVRKPKPTYPPVQASAVPPLPPSAAAPLPSSQPIAPLPPPQATVQPDGDPVVRPPMPLH